MIASGFLRNEGAIDGLASRPEGPCLAVDARMFAAQAESDRGYWIKRAEVVSSHPRLPKRVAALLALGVPARETRPLAIESVAA